jgi:MerR family redox-sensitive transcriptional activator SoxR
MNELTIGEVAHRAGIQTSAIRYYESVGLLPEPQRVSGHRRYDEGVFKQLGLIQLARQAGFRIGELQVLFEERSTDEPASTRWQALAMEKIAEMDALINHAQAVKAWLTEAQDCGCADGGECTVVAYDETGNVTLFQDNSER